MFGSTTFWVGVSLVIFLALALWKGLKPMLATLDERAERIKSKIAEAENLREDAQKSLTDYKRRQREAMKEAEEMIENAEAEARRMRERADKDFEEHQERRQRQAEEKIEQAEQAAIQAVRAEAVEVAVAAASDLIHKSMDKEKADTMIKESIEQLPEHLGA